MDQLANILARRRNEIARHLGPWGFDALVVPGSGLLKHQHYLEWLIGPIPPTRSARVILTAERMMALFLDDIDATACRSLNDTLDVRVVATFPEGMTLAIADLHRAVHRRGRRARFGVAGLASLLPLDEWQAVQAMTPSPELVDASEHVDELRAVKDPHDLRELTAAAQIAGTAFTDACDRVTPGTTPRDLAAIAQASARRLGARDALVFVSTGFLHGQTPGSSPLRSGDLVTVYSEVLGPTGYWAEQIGMVGVGPLDAPQGRLAEAALTALQVCEDLLTRGESTVAELRAAVARTIPSSWGLRSSVSPGVAHGVGVGDSDLPHPSAVGGSIERGMTFALHPCISSPELGISACCGGTYTLTADGLRRLIPVANWRVA